MNNIYQEQLGQSASNRGSSGGLLQSPTPIKTPMMGLVYNDIDAQLLQQKELLEKLVNKLQPILSPNTTPPPNEEKDSIPQPMLVETFKNVHKRIRTGNDILRSILESIEI